MTAAHGLETVEFRSPVKASAEALFSWHARQGAFQRLAPPWRDVRMERFEGIRDGDRATIRLGVGPFGVRWVAEHHGYIEGRQFCDRQVKGPFGLWNHVHRMEPVGSETSELVDRIEYRLPFGRIGRLVAGSMVRREVRAQFAHRHRITQADLETHGRYNPDSRVLRIAVSGSSGLIGSSLCAFLTTGGHSVYRLVRREAHGDHEIQWDPRRGVLDGERLAGLDAVVHLAGESLFALRWTHDKKRRIRSSRVDGTRLLAEALADLTNPPKVLVSASAIGYYGDRGSERLDESSDAAKEGFLAGVTKEWEEATQPAATSGIRTVNLRTGIVLSAKGGALAAMLPAFRYGLGGRLGSRGQWFSWVDLEDVVGAIYHVLMKDVQGPVNVTGPDPCTMEQYTRELAGLLRRPAWFPIPNGLVRLVTGELADEMLLASARVLPRVLQDTGYRFRSRTVTEALASALGIVG